MMYRVSHAVVLAVFICLLASEVLAQGSPAPAPPPPPPAAVPTDAALLRSRYLFDYRVKSPQGEDLGKVEEIMIDMELGRVAYAVLSFGGFLGLGGRWVPVPWDALTLHAGERVLVLNIDREKLEKAPHFEAATLPDLANRQWGAVIHTYYGYPPYWGNPQ